MAKLANREYAMVNAKSVNNCLVRPSTKTMGTNTQMVVKVEDVTAPATWVAPATAAFNTLSPLFNNR